MGYHISKIPKGVLGDWSKVLEERAEYEDAKTQGSKILMAVELSDMWGALTAFNDKHHPCTEEESLDIIEVMLFISKEAAKIDLTMTDVLTFSEITERAFKSGERV